MSAGLYVHVPFCAALCPYCDFAVVVGKQDLHERYCDALVSEAQAAAFEGPFDSVFVGGGTPSFVDASLLARTLDKLGAGGAFEVTIEANPESVAIESMRALRDAGVNRVSVGAQSFAPHVLRALGRGHDAPAIMTAVQTAREAGIGNVSLDLIYGGPGETPEDWRGSIEAAIALGPDHLSCYALTIEERTAFGTAVARGTMSEPEQDALAERYEIACELLADAGYRHYELSNWARPGSECRHNLLYWTQGEYLGLGLGAHSHRAGRRWWNTRSLKGYLADPTHAHEGEEHLDPGQRAEEWLALRLRLAEGIDLTEAAARLARDLPVEQLAEAGLVEIDGTSLRLTTRGMLLENEVTLRLLSFP